MIKGTICCNCNSKEATIYWAGGQPLCSDCHSEWKDRYDKMVRASFRDAGLEKFDEESDKKKNSVKKKKQEKNWFG